MTKRSGAVTFKGKPMTLVGHEIKVGDEAPHFKLVGNDLGDIECKSYHGKVRVLSVAPSIDTPVCATQTRTFNVITASDYKYRDFGEAYGVLISDLGLLTRAVFVVNRENKVVHAEYVSEVTSEPHYAAALNAVKAAV